MRLNTHKHRALFFCAALVCLRALFPPDVLGQKPGEGQQPPPLEAGDVVRINTELVQTDVTVFDKQGRFVGGLGPEQFELRVDGRAVAVSFFEQVSGATPHASATAAASVARGAGGGGGRRIIVFLDDLHLSAASVEHLRKAVPEFVGGSLGRGDQVAIVSASGQIGFLQQFTGHKSVMRAAAARLSYQPSAVKDTENPPMTEYVALRIAQGDKEALNYYTNDLLRSLQFAYALPKYGGKGPGFMVGSESDQAARVVLQRAESVVARSNAYAAATLSSLENFLRSSARLPGRKLVLFISDGFFIQGGGPALENKFRQVTDAAARAGGVIYPLDARSFTGRGEDSRMRLDSLGRTDKFSGDEWLASQASLTALAEHTGGRALLVADTLSSAAGDALAEAFNYYQLAWRPEGGGPGAEKFRHVAAQIAGRPDLTVRVARGYLEADRGGLAQSAADASRNSARQGATVKSVSGDPQSTAAAKESLPTRLAVSYLDTPGNGMVLTASTQVSLDAPAHGGDGRAPAAVDLAGVVFDDRGKSVSSFKTRLNVEPPGADDAARGAQSSVIYNYRAKLAPGIYQVRVAALDDKSGRAGHALEWVEVPDLAPGRLTLSSLLLGGQVVAAGAREPAGAEPQMQFSVDRRFRRSARLSFLLVVYNARRASSAPDLTAEIRVMRDGQPALLIPRQKIPAEGVTDARRVPYGGSFPLKSLPPGRYDLIVTVTDNATRESATQQVEFEVE